MKFSIIMPFFNSEDYIERAILSVIKQSYDNWELIAVNDGSQDNSFNIVNKYAKTNKRVKLLIKENGGYATAINFGLNNLSGNSDYFLFMGSDDELNSNALFELNEIVNSHAFDILGFRTIVVDNNEKRSYDEHSFLSEPFFSLDTTLHGFYHNHKNAPNIFYLRDTSRIYKTSLLGDLRMLGKTGVDADGIFSIMFCQKCKDFAIFPIDGYIWHKRDNSVSAGKLSIKKRMDSFSNWIHFFKKVMSGFVFADETVINYLKQLWRHYYFFVNYDRTTFIQLKSLINQARRLLIYFNRKKLIVVSKNEKNILYLPRTTNLVRNSLRKKEKEKFNK